jgi:hypothetical protein
MARSRRGGRRQILPSSLGWVLGLPELGTALGKPMRRIGAEGLRKSVYLSRRNVIRWESRRHSAFDTQNRSFRASCAERGPPI